jgi:hypothetical protein
MGRILKTAAFLVTGLTLAATAAVGHDSNRSCEQLSRRFQDLRTDQAGLDGSPGKGDGMPAS